MFTGIITAVGNIKSATPAGDGLQLEIEVPTHYLDDVALGDSIALGCRHTRLRAIPSAWIFHESL